MLVGGYSLKKTPPCGFFAQNRTRFVHPALEVGIAGVAWRGARIMALKFLSGTGAGRTSDAAPRIGVEGTRMDRCVDFLLLFGSAWLFCWLFVGVQCIVLFGSLVGFVGLSCPLRSIQFDTVYLGCFVLNHVAVWKMVLNMPSAGGGSASRGKSPCCLRVLIVILAKTAQNSTFFGPWWCFVQLPTLCPKMRFQLSAFG